MERRYDVYILSSNSRVLYVGVTSDLMKRLYQHKNKLFPGFTATYNVDRLVYYRSFGQVYDAIENEKRIKGWRRDKKVKLIESINPQWADLSSGWFDEPDGMTKDEIPRVATAPLGMTTGGTEVANEGPAMTLRNPLHPLRRRLG